jgi:restriction system protein
VESLRALSWQEFEQLVGEAYRRQGYTVEESGGGGADGGVDLVLKKAGETTLVQCKQWKTWKVGVKIVRELYGVMAAENAARGIVVACGRFTRDAQSFAEGKPLELIDGSALWELVKAVKSGSKARTPSAVQPISPTPATAVPQSSPDPQANMPACPKCGSEMVLRTARKGSHAGSQFYGCSSYPACRGTRKAGQ